MTKTKTFDMNDFQNNIKDGNNYKKFLSPDGDEVKLTDIIKTDVFGGGGSGGGSKKYIKK